MRNHVRIGDRLVGDGHSVYVIAEAGLNHGGDPDVATAMIAAASHAGADAIKFQTFNTDERFGDDEATKSLVRPAEFDRAQFAQLAEVARRHRIQFVSTAFDLPSVGLLVDLGVPAIKIASCDISNFDLLRRTASTGLPVLLSRGTADRGEIDTALAIVRAGRAPHVLLHCVSSYPLKDQDANLGAIHSLRDTYDVPIGYSDHTAGMDVPLHAVYAGACVIEKHFTLDRDRRGIDWEISLNPRELADLVTRIRAAESVLGHGRIEPMSCEGDEVQYRRNFRTRGA